MLAYQTQPAAPREILYRTRGHARGPITRLVSPSDLGEVMKPFVFLDLFHFDGKSEPIPMEYMWHPHSGIATITVTLEGAMRIADSTGADLVLPGRGVEWMRAGNGVWHTGQVQPEVVRGFQLWIALPAALENAPNESRYVLPDDVPVVGPARVVLGSYGGATNPIDSPPMTYLQVDLKDGERWTYEPPPGHLVAWVAIGEGALRTPHLVRTGEVAVFESSEAPIDFVAEGDTRFVLGSSVPHPHELHLGNYSVHTSAEALEQGEEEIRRIGRKLRDNGTLGKARPAVTL